MVASLIVLSLLAEQASGPPSAQAKAKAQVLLKQGARHYQKAEFADALEDFRRAYAIFPSPKLLLNIGQANQELGHSVEAFEALEQFIAEAGDAPEHVIAEARRSVEELDRQVGKLHIECSLPGAEILVDGQSWTGWPLKAVVVVLPGRHEVQATSSTHPTLSRDITVEAGTTVTVSLRPAAPARRPAVARSAGPVGDASASRAAKGGTGRGWLWGRTWTWVAAGSAVVFAGGAAAAGLEMRSKYDTLDRTCGRSSGASYSGCNPSDLKALDTWKNTANVLWGLSAAAAVTAGALFYFEGQDVVVAPTVGPVVGLQASMRY